MAAAAIERSNLDSIYRLLFHLSEKERSKSANLYKCEREGNTRDKLRGEPKASDENKIFNKVQKSKSATKESVNSSRGA